MKLETSAPPQGASQNQQQRQSTNQRSRRQARLLKALFEGPQTRENLDAVVGTSNSPEYVRVLRRAGLDIPCQWIPHRDRDGRAGRHGVYRLSDRDIEILRARRQREVNG